MIGEGVGRREGGREEGRRREEGGGRREGGGRKEEGGRGREEGGRREEGGGGERRKTREMGKSLRFALQGLVVYYTGGNGIITGKWC